MRILMTTALLAATTLAGATFTTTASAQGGSYTASCRNVANLGNGTISAECADGSGRFRSSTIQAGQCKGDIGNQNGVLACNGAVAQPGAYVPDGNSNNNNRGGNNGNNNYGNNNRNDNRGGNNNNVAGAAALGVVAGALLGGNLYQPGYNYPTYGQQGYGDPRYDQRFAQGGWGYGSQGQWVPIERRADWLDRRIDRGVEQGTLSRRDARNLRNELNDLVRQERIYERDGLTARERAYLDDRFDRLSARIRFQTSDNNRGYNDNRGYNR